MADTNTPASVSIIETVIGPINIGELTEGSIEGVGVFDKLMQVLRLHLDREWNDSRITGHEYAQVYTDLYQSTLNQSVEYLTRRTKLGYEILALEADTAYKEAQIEISKAQLEKIPHEIEILKAQVDQVKADTDLTKSKKEASDYDTTERAPVEVANLKHQGTLLELEKAKGEFELGELLPLEVTAKEKQLELVTAQTTGVVAETALTDARTATATAELAKVPVEVELLRKQSLKLDSDITLSAKQVEQLTAEITKIPLEIEILQVQRDQITANTDNAKATTERITLETATKLPAEVANLKEQKLNLETERSLTTSQTALTDAQASRIPSEIAKTNAEIVNLGKQSTLLERELDIKLSELKLKEKQLEVAAVEIEVQREEILVKRAAIDAQKAQSSLYAQKVVTEKAQTDGAVIKEGSVLYYNNGVLQGQIQGYKNDAENRLAKLMLDTFVTTYSNGDRTVNSTNKLTDVEIGRVLTKMFSSLNIA